MNPDEPNLYEAMVSDERSYGYGWKAGAWAERKRIIKLLEEYLSAFGAPQEQLMQRRMADFIALIKGEQDA